MGTVGEHAGFPVEALSVSQCGRWLASCSHDQLVKFSDVRDVLYTKVDGHKRLRRADQTRVLSSRLAAQRDFFGDLDSANADPTSKQTAAAAAAAGGGGDESCSEDDDSDSESGSAVAADDDVDVSDERRHVLARTEADNSDEDSDAAAAAEDEDEDEDEDDNGTDADNDSLSQDSGDND